MAKKKTNTVTDYDSLFEKIAQNTGGEILEKLDNVKIFIDTGNLAINYSCSGKFIDGGVPSGRIIEVYGPEAGGKTLIASNVLHGCQKLGGWPNVLDCENANNAEFMKKVSHLNLKRVIRHAPSTLEKAFQIINVTTREIREAEKSLGIDRLPIVFVFDSLTVPPCERELRENNLPLDYSVADWKRVVQKQEQPAERARVISKSLRNLNVMVAEQDVTVFIINQTRNAFVLYGNPETTPGGNALKFYASLRFRACSKKKIEHKSLEKFAGIRMEVKNIKNRVFRPFVVASDIKLLFDYGIDPLSGLLAALIEDERIAASGAGNYLVNKNYLPEGLEEYKFKASKAENNVDKKVLLDCPKLVNALTAEDISNYLESWKSNDINNDDYEEKTIVDDSEQDYL